MLFLGHIGMDHVICESCYKGKFFQRNYRKTMKWLLSYLSSKAPASISEHYHGNSFVRLQGTKIREPLYGHVISKSVL